MQWGCRDLVLLPWYPAIQRPWCCCVPLEPCNTGWGGAGVCVGGGWRGLEEGEGIATLVLNILRGKLDVDLVVS